VDAVADLKLRIAEEVCVVFAGHEPGEPTCFRVKAFAEAGVNSFGAGFLFGRQRLVVHSAGFLAQVSF
jgi:hypothetical protein